jgi:hypothetical protein
MPQMCLFVLQSWVHGKLLQRMEPLAMQLGSSHGYETSSLKAMMRATVLASDAACVHAAPCLVPPLAFATLSALACSLPATCMVGIAHAASVAAL